MKLISVLLTCLVLGCGGSGGGSGGSATASNPIEGDNYTGNYDMLGVGCFNNSTGAVTTTDEYINVTERFEVVGNNITIRSSSAGCNTVQTGRLVVDAANNQVTLSNQVVTSASNGNCTLNYTLVGNTITPKTLTSNFSNNQQLQDITILFLDTGGAIGLLSNYTNGQANNSCFIFYVRE